jgi:short-subunit dehydrogenase
MEKDNNAFAVITGASTGIGKAIACELAERKHNLVLHSLPDQGLKELCSDLGSTNNIKVLGIEGDLTAEKEPERIFGFVKQENLTVDILVNNAGVGFEGPLECCSKEQIETMIMLNIRALTLLTFYFTPDLKKYRESYIMNLSSFGAFLPCAFKSVYLASKSYIYYFTRALKSEFNGLPPFPCVVVPSAVRTNKNVLGRISRNGWLSQKSALDPSEVAKIAVAGMFRKRDVIIPGSITNFYFRMGLFVPEGIMLRITKNIFKNYSLEN